MAPIEHVSDVAGDVGAIRGVAAGGAQVGVSKARRYHVHGHAVFEQRRSPVGAKGVRVTEPFSDAGLEAVAVYELVDRQTRQRLGRGAAAVAAEAHEKRILVAEPFSPG